MTDVDESVRSGLICNPNNGVNTTHTILDGKDMVVSCNGKILYDVSTVFWENKEESNKGRLRLNNTVFSDTCEKKLEGLPLLVCLQCSREDYYYTAFELKKETKRNCTIVTGGPLRETIEYEYSGKPERVIPSILICRLSFYERNRLYRLLSEQGISSTDMGIINEGIKAKEPLPSLIRICEIDYLLKKYHCEHILGELW